MSISLKSPSKKKNKVIHTESPVRKKTESLTDLSQKCNNIGCQKKRAPGKTQCAEHLEQHRLYNKKYNEKRRARYQELKKQVGQDLNQNLQQDYNILKIKYEQLYKNYENLYKKFQNCKKS